MKIIIFEGNTFDKCQEMINMGQVPYNQRFREVLQDYIPNLEVSVQFPTTKDYKFLDKQALKSFDAAFWTGSSLNAYDEKSEVIQQIKQAEIIFESNIPFYGSCWGLQIAAVAAGGIVLPCKNGPEVGISKNIKVTNQGKNHPFLKGRDNFYAFCVHTSEVSKLPSNAKILATNSHSEVQALEIKYKGGTFLGVQYHPEFSLQDILDVYKRNLEEYQKMKLIDSYEEAEQKIIEIIHQNKENFHPKNHQIEISNFLSVLKN